MIIRNSPFRTKIIRISTAVITLILLAGMPQVFAKRVNVDSFLKQMSQATAQIKDFECTLESVYNRKGVSETVIAKVIFKRPDMYSVTYLAPKTYEGTKIVQSEGAGVIVNKDGTWKAYDTLTIQGLEVLNFMLRFVRDNIAQTYVVALNDKVNIEDRVAYTLIAGKRFEPAEEPEVFWIDNIKFLILQAETRNILGEQTLLKLKKATTEIRQDWDSYILTAFDLKGNPRGEITVTQVEKGLYLPTRVNLLTEFGTVDQIIRDVKVNTGVKNEVFIVKEAEEMRAKLKEAESSFSKKKYGNALKAYEHVIKLDPENIKARCNLGLCYWLTGDTEKSIDFLEAVIKDAPKFLPAYNNLGFILADTELDIKRGINLIEVAANKEPANPVYMDSLGWAYFKLGDFDKAERTIRRALLFDSSFPDNKALVTAYHHLAMVYEAAGKREEAISAIQKALEVEPFDSKLRNELTRLRRN